MNNPASGAPELLAGRTVNAAANASLSGRSRPVCPILHGRCITAAQALHHRGKDCNLTAYHTNINAFRRIPDATYAPKYRNL
ncbi:hypothetical protein ACWKWU_17330 [Chitinophaga lutea]